MTIIGVILCFVALLGFAFIAFKGAWYHAQDQADREQQHARMQDEWLELYTSSSQDQQEALINSLAKYMRDNNQDQARFFSRVMAELMGNRDNSAYLKRGQDRVWEELKSIGDELFLINSKLDNLSPESIQQNKKDE